MHPFNRQTGTNKKSNPLRSKWLKIKQVTSNNHQNDDIYSKRITMDKDWEKDFKNFLTWAIRTNYKNGMKLSRKDKTKDFTPYNCYWI